MPFAGALLVSVLSSRSRLPPAAIASLYVLLGITLMLTNATTVYDGEVLINSWKWMPEIGLALAFRLDGLTLLFAQLILGIGILVVGGGVATSYTQATAAQLTDSAACIDAVMANRSIVPAARRKGGSRLPE